MQIGPARLVRLISAALILLVGSSVFAKNVRKLTLHDLEGKKAGWSDYKGRIVVLNFWATWCGPCKEELPRLGQLADQYASQNVAFVLASIDENKKLPAVRTFVADQKITSPVWVGGSIDLLEQLSGTNVVPATLVIDEQGEIVRAINGEARDEDIKEAVNWLLTGRKGPAPSERLKRY
jgi:thiol-disulfide isomerase/thioredoxin